MTSQDEIDKLLRFVNALDKNELPDADTMTAGVFACLEKMEQLASPKRRPKKHYYIDSHVFTVAMDYAQKIVSHAEAVTEIQKLIFVGRRQAQKVLKELLPNAERTVAALDATLVRLSAEK